MMHIHRLLLEGKYPNCARIARHLEVSSKTIQRDIDHMRDQLGLPIEYDSSRYGYTYTQPVTAFPTMPATEGELLALFVAQRALEQYRGTPFEAPLTSAFAKLAEAMQTTVTVDLGSLSNVLSFHHRGAAITEMETFQAVTKALMESRELEFSYQKLRQTKAENRRIQPYHLASIDGQWYLFAHDLDRNDIRTFVLGRIRQISRIGKNFSKPKNFSLADWLMGSFGVFKGKGDYAVRIEFDPYAAQLVGERIWHASQKTSLLEDGGLELQLQLDSLEEVERWILSWGGHAKVTAPPALKKRVQTALREMNDLYAASPPWLSELHEAAQAQQPDRLLQLVLSSSRRVDHPGQMRFPFPSRSALLRP
jgi:predicted DNA-binding transcriptional regulator YafY